MSKRSLVKTLKLIALKNTIEPNEEAFLRSVQRWYSREFSTPLHVVPDLPLEDVLLNYYEDHYAALKEADDESLWLKELVMVTETPDERKQRELNEESDLVSDEEFLRQVMEEEKNKKSKVEDHKHTERPALKTNREMPEVELPRPEQMPEIKMEFIDEKELADLSEQDGLSGWDVLGPTKVKK